MNLRNCFTYLVAPSFALFALPHLDAQVLAKWNFEGLGTSGVNSTPLPSSGAGQSTSVGMSLFTGPEASGISTLQGTDGTNNATSNLTWKVRGSNGWNTAAAIGTQGAEFFASTAGDSNVTANFDWYPSTKGEAKLLVQYTVDGTDWLNTPAADITLPISSTLTLANNTTSAKTVAGSYIDTTAGNTWYNNITLNFSGISAVNNDPNFGFRLVNASTGSDNIQASGAALDNTAGNWSFDNVQISGVSAVPEPATYGLIIGGAVLLLGFVRKLRASTRMLEA